MPFQPLLKKFLSTLLQQCSRNLGENDCLQSLVRKIQQDFVAYFLRAITKGFTFWKVILFMPKSLKWAIIVQNALFMKNYIAALFHVTVSQC